MRVDPDGIILCDDQGHRGVHFIIVWAKPRFVPRRLWRLVQRRVIRLEWFNETVIP